MRFRYLHTRIVSAFVLLLLVVEAAGLALINREETVDTEARVQQALTASGGVFQKARDENIRQMTLASSGLTNDFAFRATVANPDRAALDRQTISSALENQRDRIHASVTMLAFIDGQMIADSNGTPYYGESFPYPDIIRSGEASDDLSTSTVVMLGDKLYELIGVQVRAPLPLAWFFMGTRIDDQFAAKLKSLTGPDVSFFSRPSGSATWKLMATTIPADERDALSLQINDAGIRGDERRLTIDTGRQQYGTSVRWIETSGGTQVVAALHISMTTELEQLGALRKKLLFLGVFSLLATALAGLLIGRSITKPVSKLSEFAAKLEQGDYSQALPIEREDEIGALGSAFNHMSKAIARREQELLEDGLTGLPNRVRFLKELAGSLAQAKDSGASVTVLVMDLDRFKEVNDALGHHIGDLLLKEIARRLQGVTRPQGHLTARFGGDEFTILLRNCDAAAGRAIAERLLAELEATVTLGGSDANKSVEVIASASIGIAQYPVDATDMNTLLQHAEVAMYSAKQSNSGLATFVPALNTYSEDRLVLMGELRRAVGAGQLELFYQPKVDSTSEAVVGVEALVRWNHPTRGLLGPGDFIPFAESTGFITVITQWVVRAAIAQAARWRSQGRRLNIALNISARDLAQPLLPQMIDELIREYAAEPSWLTLEITESAIMADPKQALEVAEQLHAMGFRLAIDDFGTGYSSLSYLKRLPVAELKIDRSFVSHMASVEDDATIVASVIHLAHDMGLKVVAEGVEELSAYQLLRELKCDSIQGYLIGKPQALPSFERWIDQNGGRFARLRLA